jgi:hypothetical protein
MDKLEVGHILKKHDRQGNTKEQMELCMLGRGSGGEAQMKRRCSYEQEI